MSTYYYCNTCNVAPIEGVRFHCNMCADFDECGKCRAVPESTHDPSHTWTDHVESALSLSTTLGYALSLWNTCGQRFGHSVPYGPDKKSIILVEELLIGLPEFCVFVCMSATMNISGLTDDIARVEYIFDKFRKLRHDFPGGKHIPCCRMGHDDEQGEQCPRCSMEMRVWTIMMRVCLFNANVDLLAFFLAAEKKYVDDPDPRVRSMISEGAFTADALMKAWDEATDAEKDDVLSRKKTIMDHFNQTYQWPLHLDIVAV